jgi:arylsulfatase
MKLLASLLLSALSLTSASAATKERPNIILILADDLGFSDLGCFGGEIKTPNLDALAAGGVKMSQFYNSARCCPTRASLISGLHPHQAGIGYMTRETPKKEEEIPPAYQGQLAKNTVTIAEALKASGYATMMTGKWHLGQDDRSMWPLQRGFERYYGSLSGAMNYFHPAAPRGITFDNTPEPNPKSTTEKPYYTTDAFTDYAIRFIKEEEQQKKRPFFLYLAYNAPHWPLQAPEEDIAKYRGKFKAEGWDKLRLARYERQKASGLIDPKWPLTNRVPNVPAWDKLSPEKQDELDLRMSIYAAQVDHMDQQIGKLVEYLKKSGQYDNTLIMFLADNGACAEFGPFGGGEVIDLAKRNDGYTISYGGGWATLSNTPYRLFKHFAHEGGSHTCFIAHWPDGLGKRDGWMREPAQIVDIMPTILDVAGASYLAKRDGLDIPPMEGISFLPALRGEKLARTRPMFIEHENNAFVRDGDWKLVGRDVAKPGGVDDTKWELYNLRDDGTEMNNLALQNPDRVKEMADEWKAWADRVHVYPKPVEKPKKQGQKGKGGEVAKSED